MYALGAQGGLLQGLLVVQSTAAAVLVVAAGVLYLAVSLPQIKRLDELTKVAKWLRESVERGVT